MSTKPREGQFPLIATEGFEYDVGGSERLLGSACVSGHVLKTRRNDRVVRVERRRRIGTAGRLKAALWESEDSETLHTSFVERLNLTIRQGAASVRRRSPCHARGADQLHGHVDLVRGSYHVIRPHRALTCGRETRTPAMQAGWVNAPMNWSDIFTAPAALYAFHVAVVRVPGAVRSGRPGSLLTLAPHRSGRAGSAASGSSTDSFATRRRVPAGPGSQAMATAIPKACLASSAIRCRDVETGPNLGVLAVFPSNGATCRCPLPSTGFRGLNSPASAVL